MVGRTGGVFDATITMNQRRRPRRMQDFNVRIELRNFGFSSLFFFLASCVADHKIFQTEEDAARARAVTRSETKQKLFCRVQKATGRATKPHVTRAVPSRSRNRQPWPTHPRSTPRTQPRIERLRHLVVALPHDSKAIRCALTGWTWSEVRGVNIVFLSPMSDEGWLGHGCLRLFLCYFFSSVEKVQEKTVLICFPLSKAIEHGLK